MIKIVKKKLIPLIIVLILLIAIPSIHAIGTLDIYLTVDENSVSISDSSIFLIDRDTSQMCNEIIEYTAAQTVNPDISNEEFLEGVNNISSKYGYNNINVHINSILDDNTLPIFSNVIGTSMEPTLYSGDTIVVKRTHDIQVGDIVTCNDTEYGLIVKRVGEVDGNWIYLESDNKTRTYRLTMTGIVKEEGLHKWVTIDRISGVVIYDLTKNVKFK